MVSRRRFLRTTGAALSAASLGLLFEGHGRAADWGPLVPDPAGILDLPPSFTYTVLDRALDPMSDGYRVPARPDGMACFAGPDNTYVLLRNHEVSIGDAARGPYHPGQAVAPEAYNPAGMAGVTRLVLDADDLRLMASNLVLAGSARNCAGGPSPWGWLSCEETVVPGHGYVFLCPASASAVVPPLRIAGYGRYNHEAVAVDPTSHIAYLTEDRGDGALYRFVPERKSAPFIGTLQALAVIDHSNFDTATRMQVGDWLPIAWVNIDEPDPPADTVRREAQAKGAATFARGEGIWYADGMVYVCATTGGPARNGQIFRLDIATGTMRLLAQSSDSERLDNPDNITTTPWGDLFMAEDGGGAQYIRVLHPDGQISDFARNALSNSELAGVCFSPDGSVLFVNLQLDGLTLAITGPFPPFDAPLPLPYGDGDVAALGAEPGVYTSTWSPDRHPTTDGCNATREPSAISGALALAAATTTLLD